MIIGRLLRPLRSGTEKLAGNDPRIAVRETIDVTSPAFASGAAMPAAYRGKDAVFPPLAWAGVPAEARDLVLIVEDVDVPIPTPFVHAIAYGMDPGRTAFDAGAVPRMSRSGPDHIAGAWLGCVAGFAHGYVAPTPIPGHGPHRYVFQLFALDTSLRRFDRPPAKKRLLAAMAGHVIARGAVVGVVET